MASIPSPSKGLMPSAWVPTTRLDTSDNHRSGTVGKNGNRGKLPELNPGSVNSSGPSHKIRLARSPYPVSVGGKLEFAKVKQNWTNLVPGGNNKVAQDSSQRLGSSFRNRDPKEAPIWPPPASKAPTATPPITPAVEAFTCPREIAETRPWSIREAKPETSTRCRTCEAFNPVRESATIPSPSNGLTPSAWVPVTNTAFSWAQRSSTGSVNVTKDWVPELRPGSVNSPTPTSWARPGAAPPAAIRAAPTKERHRQLAETPANLASPTFQIASETSLQPSPCFHLPMLIAYLRLVSVVRVRFRAHAVRSGEGPCALAVGFHGGSTCS